MTRKLKRLVLEYSPAGWTMYHGTPTQELSGHYRVISIVNSTEYHPGEVLLDSSVTSLAGKEPDWHVTIKELR